MDLTILIPLGLLAIGLLSLVFTSSAKYLSIREHETYNAFMIRELNNLSARIGTLEQTRPTTGEIEARLGKMK
jgi:hypothetical protein